jgi:hypothetical protein
MEWWSDGILTGRGFCFHGGPYLAAGSNGVME